MTGTAKSEAKELSDTYGLDVLKVPRLVLLSRGQRVALSVRMQTR